uniref:Uncharacterized protein n=1 Tax=Fagus sylvatica TaxID=28930 RepID=A0A2N9EPR5_FAGSY
MAPGSRGVGAVFVHFSDVDSGQTGDAIGEPRVPRRSRSHYLSNAPGLADQLVASRKDSAREGGSCAAYFCKVPDLRKSELGLVRYGPANRGHRGVFGPFEGSFPIGIPASPDKFLAIREFLVVHECVFFPMCPGSQINLLRVRKTLCASVATSVGKFPELSAKPYFVGLFSRAWPCTEASLGSQDMILRTEAVGMFLMPRGTAKNLPQFACHSLSDALAVNRLTHGSKVKVGFRFLVFSLNSTFPTSAFSFPSSSDLALRKFVRLSESKQRLRSDLTWGLPKLQIGWFNGLESQSKQVEGCKSGGSTVWNLSPNRLRGDLTWGLPKLQIGWFNGLESQSKQVEGDLTWGLPKLQIECLTGVVVAEIVAGPHALDSCESSPSWVCRSMVAFHVAFLRDFGFVCFRCHASSIEVVVALSAGSECTRIPYFRLSYLVETFLALAIQNSLFPGFDTVTDLGDSARGVHSPG